MNPASGAPHQGYWRSQFLLKVRVETAPVDTVFEALNEIRGLLAPIASSNRSFLQEVAGILRNTSDTELRARGAKPVRLGLVFDEVEKVLDNATAEIRRGDEESLFAAARVAQQWGWLALGLRDELNGLARFVAQSNSSAAERRDQCEVISGAA